MMSATFELQMWEKCKQTYLGASFDKGLRHFIVSYNFSFNTRVVDTY